MLRREMRKGAMVWHGTLWLKGVNDVYVFLLPVKYAQ
jgi:hypothetical protein